MYDINSKEFGERLRLAIKISNLTQKDLAEKVGVSKTAINNYVGGRIPDTIILYKISKFLSVNIEWLLANENPNSTSVDFDITEKESKTEFSNEETKVKHILGELSDEEIHFIDLLRQVDEKEKNKIEGMLELKIAEAQTNKKGMSSTYLSGDEAATKENLA